MKLGLGTVQLGLDYGISNIHGKPPLDEACKILQMAKKYGLNLIDTATSYGDSEKVLGQAIAGINHFDIVTKTPHFASNQILQEHADALIQTFADSLDKLKQKKVYGLLLHDADNLLTHGGECLMGAMQALKQQGLVSKIGVSVYNAKQIELLLENYQVDLIQLPLNVLDQRLVKSGVLKDLKRRNIEIHVRSVFLQGLLLMKSHRLSPYFTPFREKLELYHRSLSDCGLSLLQGALLYVNSIEEVDYAVIGVTSTDELQEIVTSLNKTSLTLPDWQQFSCDDERLINPVNWQ